MKDTPSQPDLLLALKDSALDAALEGITIADAMLPDNPLIYVNRGFEILTGYTASEVLGTNCRFLQGGETDQATVKIIQDAVAAEKPCVVEILNYHKNGTPFWNRLSITPVHDSTGTVTHYIGVQSDVTARRKAETELKQANTEMQEALDAAALVQGSLLPHAFKTNERLYVAWRFEPSATLAGDILNVFWLDEDRVACYVLDVVGHGVAAALLSFTLSHFLSPTGHPTLNTDASPAEIATALNQRFPFDTERQQFFTLLYGILNTSTGLFEYTSAGHPPLIHVTQAGKAHVSGATGFPIGVMPEPAYENHSLQMQPGDQLYLYSDGIIEAGEHEGRPWGIQGLAAFLEEHHRDSLTETVDYILAQVHNCYQGKLQSDDHSLLALEYTGTA